MWFRPRRWPGAFAGVLLLSLLLALDIGLVLGVSRRSPDGFSFLLGLLGLFSLPLIVAIAYGLFGLLNLGYHVDRNRLLIRWVASEYVIPLSEVTDVVEGSQLAGPMLWRGLRWPGCVVGRGRAMHWGPFRVFATEPPRRQLLLVTPAMAYLLSPEDREGFLAALESRLELGVLESVAQGVRHASFVTWPLWSDRVLWGLTLIGGLLDVALFACVCCRYASLPPYLPLHSDALGRVDRVGPRAELFRLPLVGLLTLLVNGVVGALLYSRERLATYLLLGGAVAVQVLLGVGLWRLMW